MDHTTHVFRAQRDLDMRLAARRIINAHRGEELPFDRLVDMTVESGAPGYYRSFDYSLRMVSLYRRGRLPSTTSDLKRAQWAELSRRMEEVSRHYRIDDMSTALGYVIGLGNAPHFYVTKSLAARVLGRKWHDDKKGVLC